MGAVRTVPIRFDLLHDHPQTAYVLPRQADSRLLLPSHSYKPDVLIAQLSQRVYVLVDSMRGAAATERML